MNIDSTVIRLRFNGRRAEALLQQAKAEVRRARRRDRPAMLHRWIRRIARECTGVVR